MVVVDDFPSQPSSRPVLATTVELDDDLERAPRTRRSGGFDGEIEPDGGCSRGRGEARDVEQRIGVRRPRAPVDSGDRTRRLLAGCPHPATILAKQGARDHRHALEVDLRGRASYV